MRERHHGPHLIRSGTHRYVVADPRRKEDEINLRGENILTDPELIIKPPPNYRQPRRGKLSPSARRVIARAQVERHARERAKGGK